MGGQENSVTPNFFRKFWQLKAGKFWTWPFGTDYKPVICTLILKGLKVDTLGVVHVHETGVIEHEKSTSFSLNIYGER